MKPGYFRRGWCLHQPWAGGMELGYQQSNFPKVSNFQEVKEANSNNSAVVGAFTNHQAC